MSLICRKRRVRQPGTCACQLTLAPEDLAACQKQNQTDDARSRTAGAAERKLLSCELLALESPRGSAAKPDDAGSGRRLLTVWELTDDKGPKRYQIASQLISHGALYTFTLLTDEAHFAAYRADFDELLASAKFTPPEMGLQELPGGYWMQRQFLFALRLPATWKPAFGASDKALLCATGAAHGLTTNHLIVQASPSKPLDFVMLRDTFPAELAKNDPAARVDACHIVPQGLGKALETVIETRDGDEAMTILERRFVGMGRNYEVRVRCRTADFKGEEKSIREALDSFREVAEPAAPSGTL